MQTKLEQKQLHWEEKYKEVTEGLSTFESWAEGLRDSTKEHLDTLESRGAELVADNNLMTNRMAGLVELEKATQMKQGFQGCLVSEDQVEVLKYEVHTYTADLWKQASKAFQEHLSKPMAKFKTWFEMAGDIAIRKENAELRKLVKSMERALQADDSKENNASAIMGAAEPHLEQAGQSLALLRSAATSPFGDIARIAQQAADEVKPEEELKGKALEKTEQPELQLASADADIFTTPLLELKKEAAPSLENLKDIPDQGIVEFGPA